MGSADHGVRPLDFPLFTDENIAPDVVIGLRDRGHDVRTVWDEAVVGRSDSDVLDVATHQERVIVTHDVGFGRSTIRTGHQFVGIIYLRPGHISASFVLDIIDALRASDVDVKPPFIVVAERQLSTVRVRARTAPPW